MEKETRIVHQNIKNVWTLHKQPTDSQESSCEKKKSLAKRGQECTRVYRYGYMTYVSVYGASEVV